MTYITLDGYVDDLDHGHIEEGAHLMKIDAAPEELESALAVECKSFDAMRAVEGEVGDAWLIFNGSPKKKVILESARDLGFKGDANGLSIRRPGQNPGGNFTWVDPVEDVYVFEYAADDDQPAPPIPDGLTDLERRISAEWGLKTHTFRVDYAGRDWQPMIQIWEGGNPRIWDILRQQGLLDDLEFVQDCGGGSDRSCVYVYTPEAEDGGVE